ncbi:TD and POZ domain-containing protein 4 [Araneus ventricosus]|uniref:TD and POZ domain-containing protein 4 n=1 Tax=Araneus ventricosus TaxID=182803 RepID=A0A4Y2KWU0_ARAVE|nr:TD and POZ domain-containing protein 4 [Araneus ventricosus]
MAGPTGRRDERRFHFTFIWAIENASDTDLGTSFCSPIFTVETMEMTKWSVRVSDFMSFMYMNVQREEEDDGPEEIEIDCELSILGANGLPLIKKANTHTFSRSQSYDFFVFAVTDDVFSRRRAEFLHRDVLTIRCQMSEKRAKTPKPEVCFARTRFGIDRHRFVWTIRNFSSFKLGHKKTRPLKSTSEGAPEHNVIFCLSEYDGKLYVCIDFECGDVRKTWSVKGEIALLDVYGEVVHSEKIFQYICYEEQPNLCIKFFETQKLLSGKTTLLSNDVLFLRCEFDIFYGALWSGIENYEQLQSSAEQVIRADVKKRQVEESKKSDIASCPFRQNVHRFYENGTLSDVSLRVDEETFPVHKFILSSRSPVFKAMFTNDMREKASKCIVVPDVDVDTLRRLLLYIYTNEVPEVEWDKTADLFRAADKYELLELKNQCSAILKSNISKINVCCVLSLADMHHEEELRKAVFDFITRNLDIFSSDIWKIFRRENSELAMETMERIIYITNSNQ